MRTYVSEAVYCVGVSSALATLCVFADGAANTASMALRLETPATMTLAEKRLRAAKAADPADQAVRRPVRALTPPRMHVAVMAAGLDYAEAADVAALHDVTPHVSAATVPDPGAVRAPEAYVPAAMVADVAAAPEAAPEAAADAARVMGYRHVTVTHKVAGKKKSRPAHTTAYKLKIAGAGSKFKAASRDKKPRNAVLQASHTPLRGPKSLAQRNRAHSARLAMLDTPGTIMFKALLNRRL